MNTRKPIIELGLLCLLLSSACGVHTFPEQLQVGVVSPAYALGSSITLSIGANQFQSDSIQIDIADESVVKFVRRSTDPEFDRARFHLAAMGAGTTTITATGGDAEPVMIPIVVKEISTVSLTTREVFLDLDADQMPLILQGQKFEFGVRFNGEEDLGGTGAIIGGEGYTTTASLTVRDGVIFDSETLGIHEVTLNLREGSFPIRYRVVAIDDVRVALDPGSEMVAFATRQNDESVASVLVKAALEHTETGDTVYGDRSFEWEVNGREVADGNRYLSYKHAQGMPESTLTVSKGSKSASVVVRGEQFMATSLQ